MYHSFLIHSSADGQLGCFHVLVIVNSATINNGVRMSLSILGVYAQQWDCSLGPYDFQNGLQLQVSNCTSRS